MADDDYPDELDYEVEWKIRAIAIPAAFVLALLFHASPTGHQLQRTFLTMIPHELGHAVTAWLSGFAAIPSLWKTMIYEGRNVLVILVVAAGNGALAWHGWRSERHGLLGAGLALGALQLLLMMASNDTAMAAFTFGGDGGAMVLGTLLVLTFFAPEGSAFRKGGLRYGLLAIGAATVVDTFATWWRGRTDPRAIPYGEIEGVGLSDPSKLEQLHGWATRDMVERYVLLGALCIAVIAAVWAYGVYTARRAARG